MNPIIEQKLPELRALCEKYSVERMYVFGSAATDRFNEQSDIDFLIALSDKLDFGDYADNYLELYYALKQLFHREIDLLTERQLKNPYFTAEVNQTKQLLYAA